MKWMPIETAPKDGTVVDLWMVDHNGCQWREADAYWVRDCPYERVRFAPDGTIRIETIRRDGWFAPNHDYDGGPGWADEPEWFNAHPLKNKLMFIKPTYWMHPPRPPQDKANDRELADSDESGMPYTEGKPHVGESSVTSVSSANR